MATRFTTRVANFEPTYPPLGRASIETVSYTGREVSITSHPDSPTSAELQAPQLETRPIAQSSIRMLTSSCKDTRTYLI